MRPIAHAPTTLATLLLLIALPAASQEVVVAGWDFSQYAGAGALTTDGATLATSLSANYSDFDPTFGAGAESAAFGTMFNDGTNGSTMTTGGFQPFVPTSGSLLSNIDGPQNDVPAMPFPDVPFDSFSVLASEGQPFRQLLAMLANQAVDVVFMADLTTAPAQGNSQWSLTFAGKTLAGTSDVDVEFAAGAAPYALVDTVALDDIDQIYTVDLGTTSEDEVFVRMRFAPDNGTDLPLIDNLMLTLVPEPASFACMLAAVATLATLRQRRGHLS